MRIVFMGTPAFAVPSLEALLEHGYEIVGVYTRPDKPAGRGRVVAQSAVKQAALQHNLPVFQPASLKQPEQIEQLRELRPELIVVAAYGLILRPAVLEMPVHGCINVHASLLPRWRGAAPIAWTILSGDKYAGITIMVMDAGIDTGAMLAQVRVPVETEDTTATLTEKLSHMGADLLVDTLPLYIGKRIQPVKQEEDASYAPMLKPEDGLIRWDRRAVDIWRQVRAFQPWPEAYTFWRGKRLIILEAQPRPGQIAAGEEPGHVFSSTEIPPALQSELPRSPIVVQTGEGLLVVKRLQLEGGRPLTHEEFLRGHAALRESILGAKE